MANPMRLAACVCLAALVSGCATFGTNVKGDFTCRAPKGDCAPSHVIDARATTEIDSAAASTELARVRAGVAAGDTSRTSERTLKIVFPAHVDEAGTLHDEAVAWAVIENPRWAAELRRRPGDDAAPPLMRELRRKLKSAQQRTEAIADDAPSNMIEESEPGRGASDAVPEASPFSLAAPPALDTQVASPPVLPSTAREAVAGAKAPAVEGFDVLPPHDRTPRPLVQGVTPTFPSIEAIEAAKAAAAKSAAPKKDHK